MQFRLRCGACGSETVADKVASGDRIACPGCRAPLVVPRDMFPPGTRIGGYELIRLIGRGGMGEVYLARQLAMDREVALKILSSEFAGRRDARERFLKEVHLSAKLEHPHIVTAYDAGEDEGVCYMAMSFVAGRSLASMLQSGVVMTEHDALRMTRKLAGALDYAWSRFRIIHRDVKPANILFDAAGEPKLADMGLSKSLRDAETLTISGSVMGTPNYMSPEQAEGDDDLDFRADLYSLGATLYHAVTGQMPFSGSSVMAVLRKQAVETLPDPREFNPELSGHCVDLLQIMLAKNPEDRFRRWAALIEDIDYVLDSRPPSVSVPPGGRSMLVLRSGGPGPHRKIVIPKEGLHSHTPAPPRPRKRSKKRMGPREKALVFGGTAVLCIALMATGMAIWGASQQAKERKLKALHAHQTEARLAAEARERSTQEARLREQAEVWQVAADFVEANPAAHDRAIANFEDVGRRLAGTKYELMASNESARLREAKRVAIDAAFVEMEARARALADPEAAAAVFAKYTGSFADELAERRAEAEVQYRDRARKAAERLTQAEREAKTREQESVAAVAEAILACDLASARNVCRSFLENAVPPVDPAAITRIAGWLEQAEGADRALLASFESQKGQDIILNIGGSRSLARIAGIQGDRVLIEHRRGVGWATGELTLAQIPIEERMSRVAAALDPAAAGIWNGIAFLRARRPDLASEAFKATGELATLLLARTEEAKAAERESAAQTALAQVLQSAGLPAGLPPAAAVERIQPGRMTIAHAAAALRNLQAYEAAHGDTKYAESNAAALAAFRSALDAARRGPGASPPVSGAPGFADMALIPTGSFLRGDTLNDGVPAELPVHTVQASAFYIDKFEVTRKLWDEVCRWAAKRPPEGRYGFDNPGGGKAAGHPVHSINWYDAVKWCNARSERDGLTPVYTLDGQVYRSGVGVPDCNWTATGYRLPTDAEWEKAARGGVAGRRFPWAGADTITHAMSNYFSTNTVAYDVSPTAGYHPKHATGLVPYTSPAGSFEPNGFGLYDMAGNVQEWCWDWHGERYAALPAEDPRGPATGSRRIVRGGCWKLPAFYDRAAQRSYFIPHSSLDRMGFRTVISVPASDAPSAGATGDEAREPGETMTLNLGEGVEAALVWIPRGEFRMGSPDDEPGRESEEGPQRQVTISGGFWIGRFEVTQRQFERLMGSTPSHFKDSGPDSPAERILWSEAASFCGRLQKLLPPDLQNRTVRLPTEAEWEYACRAGTATAMNNGTAPAAEPGFCTNVAEVAWYRGNSGNTTQPVGQKKPNAWGLHDMHGNVMEWCADRYGPYDSGPAADPEGVAVGSTRVSRGGSWSSDAAQCRSAFRRRGDPEFRDSRVGFRIVIR